MSSSCRERIEASRASGVLGLAAAFVLAALAGLGGAGPVSAQTIRSDFWITNGTVNATALAGDTLYLGGSFSAVSPSTGSGIPLDNSTGEAIPGFPEVNGTVNAVVADGSGGWYLGGQFATVGAATRNNLAHILPDLSVDAWAPSANNVVRALMLSGGALIVGGDFTSAGGQTRNRIAAIDLASGLATAWDPNANASVWSLASDAGVIYAGGDFTTIGGQSRSRIAALDTTSGLATGWNPGATGSVRALATSSGLVYAGGVFSTIGGQSRNHLAALSATTAVPTSWDPNANNQVNAIVVRAGVVYVGGTFTSVGAAIRSRIAALDSGTGMATGWNPSANSQVMAIAATGSTVYIGGDFTSAGGQARNRIAAIDATLGVATTWDPNAFNTVSALALQGSVVYAGGSFNGMGGVTRSNLAALRVTTGQPLAWHPDPNGQVLGLALGNGNVYVGGTFTSIAGSARANVAAINTQSGFATPWDPDPDGAVQAIVVRGNTVYCGGTFAHAGGQPRNNLAAVDALGAATAWDPNVDGAVFALTLENTTIHIGGSFTNAGGQPRNNLAVISLASGLAGTWNPNSNGTIRALAVDCGTVYAGGFFTNLGGQSRNRIAALDPTTGVALSWNPNANGPVFSLGPGNGLMYVGGVLNVIGGQTRNRIASIDLTNGLATAWDPNANNVIRAISVGPSQVLLGGSFSTLGALSQANVAAVSPDASVTCAPITVLPASLATGRAGTAYSRTFTASGGSGPFCFGVTAGAIPSGMSLASDTGILSGTPGTNGTYVFTVTATNSIGCTGSRTDTLIVFPACQTFAVSPDTLLHGRVGVAYTGAITAANGTAPYVFARTSGTLPAGVSLSAAGQWSGTPTTAGSSSFTVGITDSTGCTGSKAYTLVIAPPCPGIAITPSSIADAVVGTSYHAALSASAGTAPFAWVVSSGALPGGLSLDSATGALDGTPLSSGTFSFEIRATEAGGCTGSRGYTMSVFATAPGNLVAANATGQCVTTAHPCVTVPVSLVRSDSSAARAVSVTFHLDPSRITLCSPGTPATSVHAGPWLGAFTSTSFEVLDNGGGSYTVDQSGLGGACGPTGGGVLFTLDLKSVIAGDGAGAITVDAVHLRDCDGDAIPALAGAPASLTIDHTGPAAVTGLTSTQILSGNGTGGTTGIRIDWSGGPTSASVYRAPFGSYPLYDHAGPVTPPDPALAPGGPWALVAAGATTGLVDHPGARGFWMYVALTADSCGVLTASNRTTGALDYHLGDVSDEVTPGTGDDHVTTADVSLLGAHYGAADPALATAGVQYLDVGPTTDLAPTSRPKPDGVLDFEDLMMFSTNYGNVSAPPARLVPARLVPARATGDAVERFSLDAPATVTAGAEFVVTLHLAAAGGMQGFSARLGWDPAVAEPLSWSAGDLLASQNGVVLAPRLGTIDAARLGPGPGPGATGIGGEGDVASVRFRARLTGDPAFRLVSVLARDQANHALDAGLLRLDARPLPPAETALLAPAPNPTRGDAELGVTLATPASVELAVYSVDGRRVRTLAQGARSAGVYRMSWDGRDESRHPVASGVYYVHLTAAGRRFTRTLVLLK